MPWGGFARFVTGSLIKLAYRLSGSKVRVSYEVLINSKNTEDVDKKAADVVEASAIEVISTFKILTRLFSFRDNSKQ